MNDFQEFYTLALLALTYPAWTRQRYAMLWLWANCVVVLSICLAMDFSLFGETAEDNRYGATVSMLIADFCSGVGLALRPGIPFIIALGYAITVPIYFANLVFGVPMDTTWGFIYIAATAQMGVLAIGLGSGSGSGGGGQRRHSSRPVSLGYAQGNGGASGALVSRGSSIDQVPN